MLAAIGLYSVMAYAVAQRSREVGVRIALGATNGTILRMVLAEGARLSMLGVLVGCASALIATRVIQSMLVGICATDGVTYALTSLVLIVTAAIACYVPARPAALLSPTEAIKG